MFLKRLTRRVFLTNTTGAIVGSWFSFGWLSKSGSAFAADTKSLSSAEAGTMLALARTMFPHDRLDDKHYQRVVTGIDGDMAANAGLAKEIKEGLAKLESGAGGKFAAQKEDARTKAVKAMEGTPFFDSVKGKVPGYLYTPETWAIFGYEGSSWEKGGYIKRGFDDINWLS